MVATMVVPIPRLAVGRSSATSVMPAPSSPARPKPATNRSTSYCHTSVTNAFRMFATE